MVSRNKYWREHGWPGVRPDGLPEDGQVWGPRLPDGGPAAWACHEWTEAQRAEWVAAQVEEIKGE